MGASIQKLPRGKKREVKQMLTVTIDNTIYKKAPTFINQQSKKHDFFFIKRFNSWFIAKTEKGKLPKEENISITPYNTLKEACRELEAFISFYKE